MVLAKLYLAKLHLAKLHNKNWAVSNVYSPVFVFVGEFSSSDALSANRP
jgi:hypothetical protein